MHLYVGGVGIKQLYHYNSGVILDTKPFRQMTKEAWKHTHVLIHTHTHTYNIYICLCAYVYVRNLRHSLTEQHSLTSI